MHSITIWSDIGCPWSYVACLRLHRMRDRLAADHVEFDFRARPAELVTGSAPDPERIRYEMAALAQLEHTAFSAFGGARWPSTLLPAFEAQKWAYAVNQEIGERFDLALRRAMFLHSHDLSQRSELLAVADTEGLDSRSLAEALDTGRFRAAVSQDAEESMELDVPGTPVVVMPDGVTHFNPGITVEWVRGLPVIHSDHSSVYEEMVRGAEIED